MGKRKFPKWLTFFIGFTVGFGLVAGSGLLVYKIRRHRNNPVRYNAVVPAQSAAGRDSRIFAASSLDRIFQDGKTLLKPSFTEAVDLAVAHREAESFQVVVASGKNPLSSVKLEVSPFFSSDGTTAANILCEWRVVGYVPTQEPYYPTKYVGPWPDPLMPAAPTDIASGVFQPFWVSVTVPPGVPPGTYRSAVIVREGKTRLKEIPVRLKVYNFTLPKGNHLKTAFDFYNHVTRLRYPQKDMENEVAYQARIAALNERFLTEMLRYRMNPILNVDPTDNKQLALVDRLITLGLNSFSIGRHGGTFGNNWPKSDKELEKTVMDYRTYGEMLKLNRFLPYAYIYTWDEGKIGNPRVPKICSIIHRAYPGLKNMVCFHGFWDPDQDPDWGKDIDIWCFQIDNFVESEMRKLQAIGKEIWMYISGPGGYNTPNLAMDFDSIDYRIIPWLCWKYDIKGFLYWCVNWWANVDPFQSARNTRWEQNGNGLLFYPGKEGPVPSLRAEIFRDGMEDYEYIQQLMDRLKKVRDRKDDPGIKAMFDQSLALMTVDPSIARAMDDFTKEGGVLEARRRAIGEKIEEWDRLLAAEKGPDRDEKAP